MPNFTTAFLIKRENGVRNLNFERHSPTNLQFPISDLLLEIVIYMQFQDLHAGA